MVIVQEHANSGYRDRTIFNAESADVTLALATSFETAGEKLTFRAAGEEKYIGILLTPDLSSIEVARKLYKFMKERNAKTLNIAGNGIYTLCKDGFDQPSINAFLCDALEIVNRNYPIERIFSGGQTGVDMAGAVVAQYLGIPALITFPKDFMQRFEDNVDVIQTKESVEEQIKYWGRFLEETPADVPPPAKKAKP